jgi:endoglucanase
MEHGLDLIKWGADYLVRCHVGKTQFVAQVGNYSTDHITWQRPEDNKDLRPAFVVDETIPGSDVVGQAAAALAATSLAFAPYNRQYAGVVLKQAIALYNFATNYQGLYTNVVPTEGHYWSDSFRDDLAFAACWLYR